MEKIIQMMCDNDEETLYVLTNAGNIFFGQWGDGVFQWYRRLPSLKKIISEYTDTPELEE